MKFKWIYIKIPVLVGLILFLFSFSQRRNVKRNLEDITVEYTNPKDIFIPKEIVNNLLIVNSDTTGKRGIDILDLNELEKKLNQNPLIANAEVYQTITKKLGVRITQREPLARVVGSQTFYIDKQGDMMPLSLYFSARVPLVTGVDSTHIAEVFPLIRKMDQDEFLAKHITGVHRKEDGDYILILRNSSVKVNMGEIEGLEDKILNFKAFYKKANQDDLLNKYSVVNLKYRNQVVCIKKEG